MENCTQWSDEQLLSTAQKYGEEARTWRQKFLGLLPEINRRELYKQRGFSSIIHFAQVLAGVSEEQVRIVLNLERRFEDKPALHQALITGEVSVNKLARVASIATPENAEELAEKVKVLPREALETYTRDIKATEASSKSLHVQTFAFQLTQEVQEKLQNLHEKGIDINTLILETLKQREDNIEEEKQAISKESKPTTTRHIPQRTRNLLKKEHGTKCSIKACTKPAEEIHHAQRFSIAKTHDPRYMAPLCKGHHTLAHLMDQKYQDKSRRGA